MWQLFLCNVLIDLFSYYPISRTHWEDNGYGVEKSEKAKINSILLMCTIIEKYLCLYIGHIVWSKVHVFTLLISKSVCIVCEVYRNYEVVEFQPRALTTPDLGLVAYCYIDYLLDPTHPILLTSNVHSPPPSFFVAAIIGSSAHLGLTWGLDHATFFLVIGHKFKILKIKYWEVMIYYYFIEQDLILIAAMIIRRVKYNYDKWGLE